MTKRTPPKEEEPSKGLPDSIDLPVTAYLDRLETGKISVGKRFDKQSVYLDHLHAAYHYDKKEHRLHIKTADTPWSSSTGAVVLGLNKPYVLNTAIYTKGQLEGETIHGTVRLWAACKTCTPTYCSTATMFICLPNPPSTHSPTASTKPSAKSWLKVPTSIRRPSCPPCPKRA